MKSIYCLIIATAILSQTTTTVRAAALTDENVAIPEIYSPF